MHQLELRKRAFGFTSFKKMRKVNFTIRKSGEGQYPIMLVDEPFQIIGNILTNTWYDYADVNNLIEDMKLILSVKSEGFIFKENGELYTGKWLIEYKSAPSYKPYVPWSADYIGYVESYKEITYFYSYINGTIKTCFEFEILTREVLDILNQWCYFLKQNAQVF